MSQLLQRHWLQKTNCIIRRLCCSLASSNSTTDLEEPILVFTELYGKEYIWHRCNRDAWSISHTEHVNERNSESWLQTAKHRTVAYVSVYNIYIQITSLPSFQFWFGFFSVNKCRPAHKGLWYVMDESENQVISNLRRCLDISIFKCQNPQAKMDSQGQK